MNSKLISGAVLLSCGVAAVPAAAQDLGGAGGGNAGEIVVTAQRREQSLLDVPIAVTAIDASAARAMGVTTTMDLPALTPGLDLKFENNSVSTFLRGVGSTNTNGVESAVALYIDGVYYPSLPASAFSLRNVERIEVLKGPQGTLFGRNATGGVIQIVTRKPGQGFEGTVSATYANYDTVEADAYISGGLSADLAADLSFYIRRQGKGWGDYVVKGTDALKSDDLAARTKWVWTPGDVTEVILAGGYGKMKSDVGSANSPIPPSRTVDGQPRGGFYDNRSNGTNRGDVEMWNASLNISQEFEPFSLVSISSYQKVKNRIQFDQDQTPLNLAQIDTHQRQRTMTQELQAFSNSDSNIQWIAGLYFFDFINNYNPIGVSGSALVSTLRNARLRTRSYAAFGQVTVPLGENTNLTVGGRYSKDKIDIVAYNVTAAGTTNFPDRSAKANKPTWRVALDHKLNSDTMVYASYNRGFRSGGFSPNAPTEPAVDPEILDAYEVGMKTQLFDGAVRFEASGFYYDFKNIQLLRTIVGGNSIYNASNAKIKGLEMQVASRANRPFVASASLSLLDGEYGNFTDATFYLLRPNGGARTASGDATGNDTIRTPRVSGNVNATLVQPTAIGDVSFNVSYSYTSKYYFDVQNIVRQPVVHLVNLTAGWASEDGSYEIKGWGRNLLSQRYYARANPQTFGLMASPAAPLTFGATVLFHWK